MSFLPSATKLWQGNAFTLVCQSFCSQGGCLPQCMLGYTPPRQVQIPLGQVHPPLQVHPPGQVHTPGQVHPWAGTPPGRYTPRQVHPLGRYTPWAGTPPACRYTTLPMMVTAADGTPPYWNAFLLLVILKFLNVSICYNLIM